MSNINIDELADSIDEILKEYNEEINQEVEKAADKSIKKLVEATKRDAKYNPHSKGKHYREQISSKKITDTAYRKSSLWFIRGNKYGLAHLLNDGYTTRNGGRVEGDNHVTRNAEIACGEFYKMVLEAIENSGK